jgi:hypothetical protein
MKLFTAKESVAFVSEGLEAFGAMGYMENSSIPALLRDAQVLPIWEGTTNVLALDLIRALQRDQDSIGVIDFAISQAAIHLSISLNSSKVYSDILKQFTHTWQQWQELVWKCTTPQALE